MTINNKLISQYFIWSPNKSTEDTLRNILLENLGYVQRKLDQKAYSIWLELLDLGNDITPEGWKLSETEIELLKKERGILHEHEY